MTKFQTIRHSYKWKNKANFMKENKLNEGLPFHVELD